MTENSKIVDDFHSRAGEIIQDLSTDGYPVSAQLSIVTGTLGMLLAKINDNANDLHEGIAVTQRMIEHFTINCWNEQRG
jgi:hypothetical protein